MKRSRTAVAVALFALGVAAGCNDYNTSIQNNTGASLVNLAPSVVAAGGGDLTLTVNASPLNGFLTTTKVQWNGQNLVSTYVDVTTMTAVVPKALTATAGTAYVTTLTPQTGTGRNGISNALAFLIFGSPNPVPTLTSISPTSAASCGTNCNNTSVTLTVTGSNFLPASNNGGTTVTYNGANTKGQATALNVTSYSSTELKAVIPGTLLSAPDVATIQVVNPPSGVCLVNCPNLGGGVNPPNENQTFTVTGTAAVKPASAVAQETPALSQDGRYVVFTSGQSETTQVLLRDTCVGAASSCSPRTNMISVAQDGAAGNAESHNPAISADGRYVAFSSAASNLVDGAPAGRQIYLRDTCAGAAASCQPATTLISTDAEGKLNGTESILPSISASGRFVAFLAVTPSHEAGRAKASANSSPNSGLRQVFVRDTCLGVTECTPKTTRVSLQPGDAPADSSKPTGPALGGLAKHIALAEGRNSTVFTPTVAVDDQVFLAIRKEEK